ncbi:sugar ABC transporter permease [Nocardioides marmoriginsengisoli]|uniref:Xylose transport system permease protein XylH n=1 Tax=Nocardioides marmoriginsengisoli TaxID=661483 RepID=A0A3N0CED6_9ACTN|nr:sugar ABC transporter permease [Nocardioides marmoriginsengisoli]RNL61373.1 sugar ABC transporter permease [Nocardioides marmoriginsengisoli]
MADSRTAEEPGPAVPLPTDLTDERLVGSTGLAGWISTAKNRLRGGDLGNLPVILGLIIISVVFYAQEPTFLSSRQLVTITQFAAPVGIISLGIVLVLLLGEIDLSVGSMSGLAAAVMTVQIVNHGHGLWFGMLAGVLTGVGIGVLYAFLYVRVGVPSFVISLAGLLGLQGLLLYVLGKNGTINLPNDLGLVTFARYKFVSGTPAYLMVVGIVLVYFAVSLYGISRRKRADLSTPSLGGLIVRSVALLAGLLYLTYYLDIDRGWSYLWLTFVAAVVVMDLALRRTTWGRHLFAVGGNEEAARRSGIKVGRIYLSVFVLCSTLASIGGLLAAAQLTSVSQTSGTTDTNLTAIAAAVIGGTSLFGGRGSAYSALLGILVLQAIQSGLNLLGVDSSVKYMITGGVLLLAVAIDSVARRARSSSGRG